MQEAIDAFLDFDEGAVGREISNRTLDDRSRRVVTLDELPGVRLGLFHAERNLLLFQVDLEHENLDTIPGADEFGGVVDAFGPGHLGDVNQTLDTVLQLHKGAVGHDVHDLANVARFDRVASLDTVPRGCGFLLETQGDAFALEVDPQHLDFDLLTQLDHLGGMAHTAPRHVGDVQQAIDAAQVHEHAEVSDVLDGSHADLTFFDVLEQLFLLTLTLLFEQLAARNHYVHTLRIDLDDPSPDRLADEIGDVVGAAQVDLRGR